jgi:hypothetical protein
VKPPKKNPGPKIEIQHPENHVLKVFRIRPVTPFFTSAIPSLFAWPPCPACQTDIVDEEKLSEK